MIEQILPLEVASVSTCYDNPDTPLLPAEAAQLGWADERRVREFATARDCARQALSILGLPPVPILRGPAREPLWPEGIVGSITHCEGYRAAAVARQTQVISVGIDAEPHKALPGEVVDRVLTKPERDWLKDSPCDSHWERVIFSAKESVFKAWFPLTRRWLDFTDAIVTLDPAAHQFSVSLLARPAIISGCALRSFRGRFVISNGLALTSVTIQRRDRAPSAAPLAQLNRDSTGIAPED
jgi:4'-phosphopantetheinyl transferase EntD